MTPLCLVLVELCIPLCRTIDATDRQIDRLAYELYGLTEEEIGIVEKGG